MRDACMVCIYKKRGDDEIHDRDGPYHVMINMRKQKEGIKRKRKIQIKAVTARMADMDEERRDRMIQSNHERDRITKQQKQTQINHVLGTAGPPPQLAYVSCKKLGIAALAAKISRPRSVAFGFTNSGTSSRLIIDATVLVGWLCPL